MDRHTASCLVLRQCWLHLQDSLKEWILALYNINAIELSDSQSKYNDKHHVKSSPFVVAGFVPVSWTGLPGFSFLPSFWSEKKTWTTMKILHPNITSSRNFWTWIIFQKLASMISCAYFNMSHSLKAGAKCGLLKDQSHQSRWQKNIETEFWKDSSSLLKATMMTQMKLYVVTL